jgi:hypothetical protein
MRISGGELIRNSLLQCPCNGEVQEWLNWPLSKSGVAQVTEGSNPSLSARREPTCLIGYVGFLLVEKIGI